MNKFPGTGEIQLRGLDSNQRPPGYEPSELPLLHPATSYAIEEYNRYYIKKSNHTIDANLELSFPHLPCFLRLYNFPSFQYKLNAD